MSQDSILHTIIFRVIELAVARNSLDFFFQKRYIHKRKKIEKIHMDSEKSINLFEIKKR